MTYEDNKMDKNEAVKTVKRMLHEFVNKHVAFENAADAEHAALDEHGPLAASCKALVDAGVISNAKREFNLHFTGVSEVPHADVTVRYALPGSPEELAETFGV